MFVSHGTLRLRKTLPRAIGPWCLDSRGFTELSLNGRWTITPREYVTATRRYISEVGNLLWASQQDWMCEPWIIEKTGLSVAEHQRRTVANYLDLAEMAPDVPWVPVLQGWEEDDYLRHVDQYTAAGIDLRAQQTVGIGSVCRRQGTLGAIRLLMRLAGEGIRLHGFGLKTLALRTLSPFLTSADSMAWSYTARRLKAKCGTPPTSCANHLHYAQTWREYVLSVMGTRPAQLPLGV